MSASLNCRPQRLVVVVIVHIYTLLFVYANSDANCDTFQIVCKKRTISSGNRVRDTAPLPVILVLSPYSGASLLSFSSTSHTGTRGQDHYSCHNPRTGPAGPPCDPAAVYAADILPYIPLRCKRL